MDFSQVDANARVEMFNLFNSKIRIEQHLLNNKLGQKWIDQYRF